MQIRHVRCGAGAPSSLEWIVIVGVDIELYDREEGEKGRE